MNNTEVLTGGMVHYRGPGTVPFAVRGKSRFTARRTHNKQLKAGT